MQAFEKVLNNIGVNPRDRADVSRVCFLEDSRRNLIQGKSLGMRTIHVIGSRCCIDSTLNEEGERLDTKNEAKNPSGAGTSVRDTELVAPYLKNTVDFLSVGEVDKTQHMGQRFGSKAIEKMRSRTACISDDVQGVAAIVDELNEENSEEFDAIVEDIGRDLQKCAPWLWNT